MNPLKILFICTHNRCRSILAEACANTFSNELIVAASAGSEPAGKVHPMTLVALERRKIPNQGLRSKSWDELEDFDADFVITVCDNAAQEKCPLWFGTALKAHWGLSDPSLLPAESQKSEEAYNHTIDKLIYRIEALVQLLENDPGRTAILNLLNALSEDEKT